MAPGGNACKEVIESHSPVADYDIASAKSESNNATSTTTTATMKTSVNLVGKHGIHSNNGVYELLECPVCTNLMYPPIHQVCYACSYSGSSIKICFCSCVLFF